MQDTLNSMIQPFTSDDLLRISQLQPDGWQDIEPFFRFYVNAPICRAYKIEDRKKIVAIGALILHQETAWLAHIIVAPEARRKGLGISMTEHLLESCEKLGRATQLLIATKMGEPLYRKLGFHISCDYRFYHLPPRIEAAPSPAVRVMKPSDFPAIMALDSKVSGESRRTLLSAYTDNARVYCGNAGVRGYYLPDLGEGLVVAQDAEAGQALMKHRLARADAAPVLPADNHAANQCLRDLGLMVKHSAARMIRNGTDTLRQDMLFNRIGGHLG